MAIIAVEHCSNMRIELFDLSNLVPRRQKSMNYASSNCGSDSVNPIQAPLDVNRVIKNGSHFSPNFTHFDESEMW